MSLDELNNLMPDLLTAFLSVQALPKTLPFPLPVIRFRKSYAYSRKNWSEGFLSQLVKNRS